MPILDLVIYPDERLREVCKPVTEFDGTLKKLLDDMAETMYEAPGIGLAAPQVGVLKRVIVVDVGDSDGQPPKLYRLVNPEIVAESGDTDSEEGCLSIPDIRETIGRFEEVTVEAFNEAGKPVRIEAEGMLAICLQHEIDHLNGVLFIDHLSKLRRQLINSKLKRLKKS